MSSWTNHGKHGYSNQGEALEANPASEQDHGKILARTLCYTIAKRYWKVVRSETDCRWQFRQYRGQLLPANSEIRSQSSELFHRLNMSDREQAGFQLANIYSEALPADLRSQMGIFYTPPPIVRLMLEETRRQRINLKTAKVIDPASGGSAFLAPLCRRMVNQDLDHQDRVDDLVSRLKGVDLDPFAAWLSQFLVDCELAHLAPLADRPNPIVTTGDALLVCAEMSGEFDYVIGNPPYRKMRSTEVPPSKYDEIVSGAPNLYQLFLKLALDLVREKGVVQLITPTGYIGGRYFQKLRSYLLSISQPLSFSFFDQRTNVFAGVRQELVISCFRKGAKSGKTRLLQILSPSDEQVVAREVGKLSLPKNSNWVLPKNDKQLKVATYFSEPYSKLKDVGLRVSTGWMVPHRSAHLLRERPAKGCYPLLWSDVIKRSGLDPSGIGQGSRKRWALAKDQSGLISQPAILIKRTSSKEQSARIHTAIVSDKFISKYGGFVAENHINVVTKSDCCELSLNTISRYLQTELVDNLFRCISGTVTVSASELERIPFPDLGALRKFELLLDKSLTNDEVEQLAVTALAGEL